MPDDKLMSIPDLAKYLQVPPSTIYRWASSGTGPRRIRVGRHVRFRRVDVDHWLDSRAPSEQ